MRVLLVGEGPAATRTPRFADLRRAQFLRALEGFDVAYVDARAPAPPATYDAVVSAGVYLPGKVALALAGGRPLWIDLAGDPFADAQAYAWAAPGRVASTERDALDTFLPQLRRAEAFSVVSGPSRYAVLGMLGAVGRLVRTPPGEELVHVLPVPWLFPQPAAEPVPWTSGPLRVVLAGSLNTWFDLETAFSAVERAAAWGPVVVDVLGGAVPGHHPEGEAWLRARTGATRARWNLHGWIDDDAVPTVLRGAHVGLCLDRPGYEPELGSRTRVLFCLHLGLRVVATVRCELLREVRPWIHEVPIGDPAAVAEALLQAARADVPDRAPLRARYDPAVTASPLRAWVSAIRGRA